MCPPAYLLHIDGTQRARGNFRGWICSRISGNCHEYLLPMTAWHRMRGKLCLLPKYPVELQVRYLAKITDDVIPLMPIIYNRAITACNKPIATVIWAERYVYRLVHLAAAWSNAHRSIYVTVTQPGTSAGIASVIFLATIILYYIIMIVLWNTTS